MSGAPGALAEEPYATVEAPRARVHLASEPRGLEFQRQSGTVQAAGRRGNVYTRLCAAPCDITLPVGRETIRVVGEDGSPLKSKFVDFPAGSSELHVTIEDNQSTRNIGWVTLGVGVLGGAALVFTGVNMDDGTAKNVIRGSGWVLGLAGIGVGIAFLAQSDDVIFEQRRHAGLSPRGTRTGGLGLGFRGAF